MRVALLAMHAARKKEEAARVLARNWEKTCVLARKLARSKFAAARAVKWKELQRLINEGVAKKPRRDLVPLRGSVAGSALLRAKAKSVPLRRGVAGRMPLWSKAASIIPLQPKAKCMHSIDDGLA